MVSRLPLSLLLLSLSSAALLAADASNQVGKLEPMLGKKGPLLLEEKFDGDELPKGWTTKSGKLHLADGVLHATQTKESGRLCLFNCDVPMRDAAVQID